MRPLQTRSWLCSSNLTGTTACPPVWREQHFGAAWFARSEALALADPDADEVPNLAEWLADTDPNDGDSKPVPPPVLLGLTPPGGEFDLSVEVRAHAAAPVAVVRYTLNGADPDPASPFFADGLIVLYHSATLKARAYVNDNPVSPVVSGSYTVREQPPRITHSPVSRSVLAGNTVTFEVSADGTPPLEYQWLFNGEVIPWVVEPWLVLTNVQPSQAGAYAVRVSNALGTAISKPAILTVNEPPRIVRQPVSITVAAGHPATFSVEVTGTEPLTYHWYRNNLRLAGEPNAPELTLPAAKLEDAGSYNVRVFNAYGTVHSVVAMLRVVTAPEPPQIVTHPAGQTIQEGQDVVLSVVASGVLPLAYQWFRNGRPLAGATGAQLEIAGVKPDDADTYWVRVTNPGGETLSRPAVLQVIASGGGGTVNFANRVPVAGIDAPVFDSDGTTRLTGLAYLAQLYAGPAAEALAPVGWAVPFNVGNLAGYVTPPSVVVIPTVPAGAVAWVQLRAWESSRGATYEEAFQAGGKVGTSEPVQVTTGGAGHPPSFPADLVGLTSFRLLREAIPPMITIHSPAAGVTGDDRLVLTGAVTDNAAVASAAWEWNGREMGALELDAAGGFRVSGPRLARGENLLRVTAADTAGNTAAVEVRVVYEPVRLLAVTPPAPLREGRRVAAPVVLSSPGDESGLTFVLRYAPERFRDPVFAWADEAPLPAALKQVNAEAPGEVRATLSLPGQTLPAGVITLGVFSLRACSVPEATPSDLIPDLVDIAERTGEKLEFGNAADKATAHILPRRLLGDNNGNDLLDVGDAALMQRLLTRLDLIRPWDHTANDLNASGDLDSGDMTRVLRVVVGLDLEPVPLALTPGLSARRGPALASPQPAAASAAALTLTADSLLLWPGETITVRVSLAQPPAGVSGVSFRLNYPTSVLRPVGERLRTGPAVPAEVSALVNVDEAAGQVGFAASGAGNWPAGGGVVLELAFQVLATTGDEGVAATLDHGQLAWDMGYEIQNLPSVTLTLLNPASRLNPVVAFTAEEAVSLTFSTRPDVRYLVEVSEDLQTWTPRGTVEGTGDLTGFIDPDRAGRPMRFYRIRADR